jgi:ferritin
MISKKLQDAISEQIKNEWWSAGIYKAMSAYFTSEDLQGFAHWMDIQAQEELTHGEIFFRYLGEVGGRARILAIPEPKNVYKSPLDAIDYGLSHERMVTALINKLMDQAKKENDHAASIMLQWFVTEQVEEEANFSLLAKKLKLIKGDGRGLLMLDQELAVRIFSMPSPLVKGAPAA